MFLDIIIKTETYSNKKYNFVFDDGEVVPIYITCVINFNDFDYAK